MSHDRSSRNESHLLVTSGTDHYHGNIYGRIDRDIAGQEDGFAVLLAATTAWLDWNLRGNQHALMQLKEGISAALPADFAALDHREAAQ